MRAVQMWAADDGKMFNNEKDCRKYELDTKISNKALSQCRVWDGDFQSIKISEKRFDWIERVGWVYAPTEACREALNALCRKGGYYEFFINDTKSSSFIERNDNKYGFIDMENALFKMKVRMHAMKNS